MRYLNRHSTPGYTHTLRSYPDTGTISKATNQYPAFYNSTSPYRDRFDDVTPYRDSHDTVTPSTDNTTSTGGTRRLREDPVREVLTQFLDIYQTNQYQLEKRSVNHHRIKFTICLLLSFIGCLSKNRATELIVGNIIYSCNVSAIAGSRILRT